MTTTPDVLQLHSPASFLVVFDCDSTLIQDEVIELIADAAGSRDLVAEITERAMRGELDFSESLAERVATLEGVSENVFQEVIDRVRVTPGAQDLIDVVHDLGGIVGVVSGGFHEVLDSIAASLRVDVWRANRLEVRDGSLTGKTRGAVVDGAMKAATLQEWAQAASLDPAQAVAIGDGANDIPMMRLAGFSIAFNAKPVVREVASMTLEHDLSGAIPQIRRLFS